MPPSELRFHVAGLEVTLAIAGGDAGAVAGFYREYPPLGTAPGLVVDIERVPGFARGRTRGPAYPAFDTALVQPGTIVLSRFDAEGQITIPSEAGLPVRARFRVGESPNSLEAAIRVGMSIALPRVGGLVLHASSILAPGLAPGAAPGGGALIFAGTSGAGKSTIAELLAGRGPAGNGAGNDAGNDDGVTKLADELLIVTPGAPGEAPAAAGTWQAHVTPFLGGQGLPHGARAPVAGLHFLVQAPHHRRTPLPRAEALRELLRHVLVYVAEPLTAARVLSAAASLAAAVPCHRLEFARDPGVAGVLGVT